jgi:phage-related protein
MSYIVQYDDLDISDSVETIAIGSPKVVNMMSVPKRHGGLVSEVPTVGPRVISIRGKVQEQDFDTFWTKIDNLEKVFARFNKKFYLRADRYIWAYPMSFGWAPIEGSGGLSAAYTIELKCADPFWYATSGTVSTVKNLTSGDTIVDITAGYYKEAFNIANTGTVFAYLKVTVNAVSQITRAIVRNLTTNRTWTYTGTVPITKNLIVDSGNFLVTNDGTEDLTNWSGSFIWLDPGTNSLEIEGTVDADYTLEYSPRYY